MWADFGAVKGRAKAGHRPAVVVQNDVGNEFSPMTIVVPITDKKQFKDLPVQVLLASADTPLEKDSCAECGHVITFDIETQIDQNRGVVGQIDPAKMKQIDSALRVSLGL